MFIRELMSTVLVSLVCVASLCAQDWAAVRVVGIEYPPIAAAARVQGMVVIQCDLDPSGKVISTERLDKTSMKPDLLGDAAQANAREWLFTPVTGTVGRRIVLTYIFEVRQSQNYAVGQTTRTKFIYEAPQTVRAIAELPAMQIQSTPPKK
jgi:TonB family protein